MSNSLPSTASASAAAASRRLASSDLLLVNDVGTYRLYALNPASDRSTLLLEQAGAGSASSTQWVTTTGRSDLVLVSAEFGQQLFATNRTAAGALN